MKLMTSRMAALKKAGKPMPKTMDEVEQTLGSWRGHKQQQEKPFHKSTGDDLIPTIWTLQFWKI